MRKRIILTEDTLKAGASGEDRFKTAAHEVTVSEVAAADSVVIMIDGRVEVVKAKNYGTSAELVGTVEVKATGPIEIYPAQNGGFLVREGERPGERMSTRGFIAACSDLTDLLEAVDRYYQTEADITGDVDLKGCPDVGDSSEERMVTDGAAAAEGNGGDFYYVLVSGPQSDPHKNVSVFYDEDAMKRAMELVWNAGGVAWARPACLT